MTAFQLDECNNYGSFARRCNVAGLVALRRYKNKHKGTLDPVVIERCVASDCVLLTIDNNFYDDNAVEIPSINPGVVVVEHSPNVPYTMTQASMEKIIAAFKVLLPDWHSLLWNNSLVTISEAYVSIKRKTASGIAVEFYAQFGEGAWQDEFRNVLAQNAADQ